jgi:uncharacterized membrane protein YeaQ/YmgE (transglycosylase-associated protein family)
MHIIGWVIVGLLAGGLARMLTGSQKRGCIGTMAIGLIGALIGGALAQAAFHERLSGFGFKSIVFAALGATLLLLILQALGIVGQRRNRNYR